MGEKVFAISTLGTGSYDERRILDLLSRFNPTRIPFDRQHKRRSAINLWKVIRREKSALFALEGTGLAGGLPLILARMLFGRRYVVSSGDAVGPWIGSRSRLLQPFFAIYERLLYRLAAGFIGWTPYLVGRALTAGVPRAMTAAGWAPYRLSAEERFVKRQAMRQSLGIEEDTIVVGIAGSLVWSSRYQYCYGRELIEAAKRCQRSDVCWLIVGDGDGRKRMEHQAASLSVGRVVFTGRVPQEELPAYLAAMDIGSLPQSVDGVGSFRYTTKVSEYLAFQLPFMTGQIPLAYDFPADWLWRLAGANPWSDDYVDQIAKLIQGIGWEEIRRKRDAIPTFIETFDRERQIERATRFIEDILNS